MGLYDLLQRMRGERLSSAKLFRGPSEKEEKKGDFQNEAMKEKLSSFICSSKSRKTAFIGLARHGKERRFRGNLQQHEDEED